MKDYTEALHLRARITDRAVFETTLTQGLESEALMVRRAGQHGGVRIDAGPVQGILRYATAVDAKFDARSHPDNDTASEAVTGYLADIVNTDRGPAKWGRLLAGKYVETLAGLPTVWVSPGMVAKALEMDEVELPPMESLPFPDGCLLVLAEPLDTPTSGGTASVTEAVAWWPTATGRACLTSYGTNEYEPATHLDLVGLGTFGHHVAPVRVRAGTSTLSVDTPDAHDLASLAARLMALLARAPGDEESKDVRIAVVEAEGKDAKRLAKKRGFSREVNVIYLSDEKSRALGTGSGVTPNRHRVRAHWRWARVGPGRKLRRWVLVAEHERGQGECDERERVYAAGRA